MTFTDPRYLWLLIPALAWTIWVGAKMRGSIQQRKIFVICLRAIVLILLILALAGAQTVRKNKGVATVFALDKSASMTSEEMRRAEAFITKALEAEGPDDISGLVVFAKDPIIDTETGNLRSLDNIYASPDPSSTDIAAAIRLASATIPEGYGKRVVLLTDGNETSGDAADAAQAASADGVEIDSAPIFDRAEHQNEVMVESVDAPNVVTRGQPFELRVAVESTGPASGTLYVDRDGVAATSVPVSLVGGENVIAVNATGGDPGFYRYRASLQVDNDTDPRNNVGMAYVNVLGRPSVLLVEGTPGSSAALQAALKVHDIDVVRVGAGGVPTRPEDLQSYDAIILSDFPASSLTDPQMSMITSAVRDSGLGFGMIGGDNSFLPGGYYATPIADALPVDMNVRQRKVFPSTCIEIVIDASGSMSIPEDGMEKVKIAGTAAAAMVRMLSPNDLVGVAGSTDDIRFVAPIQSAANKELIAQECGTIEAGGGGIYIEPSLEFAERTLRPINTKVRHLILMSDGDDAEAQPGSFELAQKMVNEGMTVSVVAIGDGKDVGFLQRLAAIGKGYYYLASQAKMLQRIVTQDSSLMARSAIEVGAFIPRMDPTDEVLQGIDPATVPPLYAYDLTGDRPLARTPMRTDKDDPLLAYWQYGLGTSMAFTSDAQPKWARHWMTWSGFSSFWAQAIRATMRDRSSDNIQINSYFEGGHGIMDISAFDQQGDAINNLAAKVSVISPDGTTQPVTIEQVGPGRYSGSFDASQTGGYVITAAQQAPGTVKPVITRSGFAVAYPPEYQAIGPNTDLLTEITKITGGIMCNSPVDSFRPAANPGESVKDLWPGLLLASALLLVMDIAVRRLAIPFAEIVESVIFVANKILPQSMQLRTGTRRRIRKATITTKGARIGETSAARPTPVTSLPRSAAGAVTPVEPQTDAGADSPEPVSKPKPARESPGLTATQRLLDAKRKARADDKSGIFKDEL